MTIPGRGLPVSFLWRGLGEGFGAREPWDPPGRHRRVLNGGMEEVEADDAAALAGEGAYLLDVREDDEWAAGHVAESVHIAMGELGGRIAELPTDRRIVAVCRSG